jgi:hypothetical protein
MARITILSTENEQQLNLANQYLDKLATGKGPSEFSEAEIQEFKAAATDLLTNFGPMNRVGNFADSIDGEISRRIQSKEQTVRTDIQAAVRRGEPTPLDYYEIYTKVLQDSGLIINSLPDPATMRELNSRIRASGGTSPLDARRLILPVTGVGACDACIICNGCSACGLCGTCTVSLVMALAATGLLSSALATFISGGIGGIAD